MSEYLQIRKMPTTMTLLDFEAWNTREAHESILRSHAIIRKVKWLLELGTPTAVIMELIDLMESDPNEK